jgi:multiple sugar transport system ATP-binding protein
MASIILDRLTQKFGATVALADVSIEIPPGEFLVLLGPSGCGKTTLLRLIAGLLTPTSGRVVIDDADVTALAPGARNIAMVFQSYALYPHMSVRRNLGFGLRVRHRPKAEISAKVDAVAEQLQLTDLLDRKPKALSGGQRQRTALGRAMVADPKAFLMDEPLSNLDAQLRTATRLELAELHRRLGTTFIYVTHDQVEAMTMATRIAVLNGGRLEQLGSPTEVYDDPATTFVATFIGAPPMNLIPAKVRSVDGKVRAVARGVEAELFNGDIEERDVLLGIRPEHLVPLTGPAAVSTNGPVNGPAKMPADLVGDQAGILAGVVVAVENLGSEEVGFCDIGQTQVAVRGPRPLGLSPGDPVLLGVPAHRCFLFDPVSTRRLIWMQDPAPVPAVEESLHTLGASPHA